MLRWLTLGATLGLDSMRASAVLGVRGVGGPDRIFLPLAFGTADGLATAAGLWLGRPVVDALESEVQFAAAAVLVVYGPSLLIPDKATPAKARFVLPVVLSFDNLGAGVALAAASAPAAAAVLLGVASGAMSAIGLGLGTRIGRLIPRSVRTTAALAFLALAVGAVAA